jgi:hypothetical protein
MTQHDNQNVIGMEKFIESCQIAHVNSSKKRLSDHEIISPIINTTTTTTSKISNATIGSQSVLLLTPTPSYASMLSISSVSASPLFISPDRTNNILVDTSVLFLNYYKKIVKLLFDSMNVDTLRECVKSSKSQQYSNLNFNLNRNNNNTRCYPLTDSRPTNNNNSNNKSSKCNACLSSTNVCPCESLDGYLERLTSNPRSLKSMTRRNILDRLVELQEARTQRQSKHKATPLGLISTSNLVNQLPLPKRLKSYLLYFE